MKLRAALGVLAGMFVCSGAMAAGALAGVTVVSVRVDSDGRGVATFNYPLGGTPASCAIAAYNNALSFNAGNAGGQATLAVLLTAKSTGALVWMYGLGSCSIYPGNVEDLNYVVVQ